jgi:hypothetical protein
MSKYRKLLEFIPYLEDPSTRWLGDNGGFFYCDYSEIGSKLICTIEELTEGPSNTYQVIEKYNIETINLDDFDYENCPYDLAFALIALFVREERFCAGSVFGAISRGHMLKLIKVLESYENKYEIVAISGERTQDMGIYEITIFVRAYSQYYYFNYYGNLSQGKETGKQGDIPLGNWFLDIREFTKKDYDDYPEFVKAIDKYFKER